MNLKKKYVIDRALELFIEQGYHATSIQDIVNHSGISKGSFYNYCSSKGEVFKGAFVLIHDHMKIERDKLLIGADISDKEIFIDQITLMININRKNKLNQLIEEVLISNDIDLIQFVKESRYFLLHWIYGRFINIFPNDNQKYMFDCAVLYSGMLQNILHTGNALKRKIDLRETANYCLDRVITILADLGTNNIQLFASDSIEQLLPRSDYNDFFNNEFSITTVNLKKVIEKCFICEDPKRSDYLKLLYFIQEEIMNMKEDSRVFLIQSALTTLKSIDAFNQTKEFIQYEQALASMDYYPII